MTTDDFGNVVEATHDLDLEYVYPPRAERICAQDEHYATKAELVALAGEAWAVIDELEARIAKLEAAQPKPTISRWPAAAHPPEGDWAHIQSAEWEAICEELESLRKFKAGVPWEAIDRTVRYGRGAYMPDTTVSTLAVMGEWCDAYMPKEFEEAAE